MQGLYAGQGSIPIVDPEMMPIAGSKIYVNTQTKILAFKYKVLAVKENKSQKRKQTQTQVIYPGSVLLTYI